MNLKKPEQANGCRGPTQRAGCVGAATDLLRAAFRSGQPEALFQQVDQMVHDHLALLLASHLLHEHLEHRCATTKKPISIHKVHYYNQVGFDPIYINVFLQLY